MSSYKPPFARMRQILKNAPPPLPKYPQNVEEAVREVALKQDVGEKVADEIRVPVGILDAVIKPGPDKVFGTEDDVISIEVHKDDGKHDHEPEVVEPEVVEPEPKAVEPKPSYSRILSRKKLIALAKKHNIELVDSPTKAQILSALDAHFG